MFQLQLRRVASKQAEYIGYGRFEVLVAHLFQQRATLKSKLTSEARSNPEQFRWSTAGEYDIQEPFSKACLVSPDAQQRSVW